MKAIHVREFGGPEVLKLEEIPTPKPAAGQIFVRVHAAGVNPYDTYMRNGNYADLPPLPYTPGTDAAGTVEVVGYGVAKVKPGDRVYVAKTISWRLRRIRYRARKPALPSSRKNDLYPRRRRLGALWHGLSRPYHSARPTHRKRSCSRRQRRRGHRRRANCPRLGPYSLRHRQQPEGPRLVHEGAHQVFNHCKPGYPEEIMKATGGRGVDIILEMLANVNLANDLKLLARTDVSWSLATAAKSPLLRAT